MSFPNTTTTEAFLLPNCSHNNSCDPGYFSKDSAYFLSRSIGVLHSLEKKGLRK